MKSRVQRVAQEQLRELLVASAHFDRIDALDGELQQQAADAKAATRRAVEILTAANSDEECLEALRLVEDIIRDVMHKRPLQ
jgi:hypothetical protein